VTGKASANLSLQKAQYYFYIGLFAFCGRDAEMGKRNLCVLARTPFFVSQILFSRQATKTPSKRQVRNPPLQASSVNHNPFCYSLTLPFPHYNDIFAVRLGR
jgi:hypothetical protein